jgi:hypothetical protein
MSQIMNQILKSIVGIFTRIGGINYPRERHRTLTLEAELIYLLMIISRYDVIRTHKYHSILRISKIVKLKHHEPEVSISVPKLRV